MAKEELEPAATSLRDSEPTAEELATLRELSQTPKKDFRFLASAALGTGLRFNNPYRLSKELGSNEQSLSLTHAYTDFGVAAAYGPPNGLQHGLAVRMSVALGGTRQSVLTPSYFGAYRGAHQAMIYGRLGPAIILLPDPNVGGELAIGGAYFVTGAIGVSGELVGDLFYGAGTRQVKYSVYPVVSGQVGIVIDYEVLP